MQILLINNFTVFRVRNVFAPRRLLLRSKKVRSCETDFSALFPPPLFLNVLRVMLRTITLSAILITKFIFLYVFITAFIED